MEYNVVLAIKLAHFDEFILDAVERLVALEGDEEISGESGRGGVLNANG